MKKYLEIFALVQLSHRYYINNCRKLLFNMKNSLTYEELLELVTNVLTSNRMYTEEELCIQLAALAANCPDPLAARKLITESFEKLTAEAIVQRALSYPQRDGASYTEDELPKNHYLRFLSEKTKLTR